MTWWQWGDRLTWWWHVLFIHLLIHFTFKAGCSRAKKKITKQASNLPLPKSRQKSFQRVGQFSSVRGMKCCWGKVTTPCWVTVTYSTAGVMTCVWCSVNERKTDKLKLIDDEGMKREKNEKWWILEWIKWIMKTTKEWMDENGWVKNLIMWIEMNNTNE